MEDRIILNIGGKIYETNKNNIKNIPYFSALFNSNWDIPQPYFIDLDRNSFKHVLRYIKNPEYKVPEEYHADFDYLGIELPENLKINKKDYFSKYARKYGKQPILEYKNKLMNPNLEHIACKYKTSVHASNSFHLLLSGFITKLFIRRCGEYWCKGLSFNIIVDDERRINIPYQLLIIRKLIHINVIEIPIDFIYYLICNDEYYQLRGIHVKKYITIEGEVGNHRDFITEIELANPFEEYNIQGVVYYEWIHPITFHSHKMQISMNHNLIGVNGVYIWLAEDRYIPDIKYIYISDIDITYNNKPYNLNLSGKILQSLVNTNMVRENTPVYFLNRDMVDDYPLTINLNLEKKEFYTLGLYINMLYNRTVLEITRSG